MRSISKLVSTVMTSAGIEGSAHALRHTVATRLAREHGRDLALVADILGHADLNATRDYVRSDLEDRRAAPKIPRYQSAHSDSVPGPLTRISGRRPADLRVTRSGG